MIYYISGLITGFCLFYIYQKARFIVTTKRLNRLKEKVCSVPYPEISFRDLLPGDERLSDERFRFGEELTPHDIQDMSEELFTPLADPIPYTCDGRDIIKRLLEEKGMRGVCIDKDCT